MAPTVAERTRHAHRPRPMGKTEHARRWAIAVLRKTADALERAPRRLAGEVLMHLGPALQRLERTRRVLQRECD